MRSIHACCCVVGLHCSLVGRWSELLFAAGVGVGSWIEIGQRRLRGGLETAM